MRISSILLIGAILFSSQKDVDALPQQLSATQTVKTSKATMAPGTAKPTKISTKPFVSTKQATISPEVTSSALKSSRPVALSSSVKPGSAKSKPGSSVSSKAPIISGRPSSHISGLSSGTFMSMPKSSISFASSAPVDTSALPSSVVDWNSFSSTFSENTAMAVPTPATWTGTEPTKNAKSPNSPSSLAKPMSSTAVPFSKRSDPSPAVSILDSPFNEAAPSISSTSAFELRGTSNIFGRLEDPPLAIAQTIHRRVQNHDPVDVLYHGTCGSAATAICQPGGLRLPPFNPGDFSYKGGVYFTTTFENAMGFATRFRNCEYPDPYVVVMLRFARKGLVYRDAGFGGQYAENFNAIQRDMGRKMLNGETLSSGYESYKNAVDSSDVIVGTVKIPEEKRVQGGPRDPFTQYVFVSDRGLASLECVDSRVVHLGRRRGVDAPVA